MNDTFYLLQYAWLLDGAIISSFATILLVINWLFKAIIAVIVTVHVDLLAYQISFNSVGVGSDDFLVRVI